MLMEKCETADFPRYTEFRDEGAETAKKLGRFAFLLLPGYSNFSLQALREPLQLARNYGGVGPEANWLISVDGDAVRSADDSRILVDYSIENVPEFDILIICGGDYETEPMTARLVTWLQQQRGRDVLIGGVESGCVVMAQLGLLDGYRATAHWRFMSSLSERFPRLQFESSLFEIDRDRFTCAGGVAGLDLMLELISQQMGEEVALHCLNHFNQERQRSGNEPQRLPGSPGSSGNNLKLKRAMLLIQNSLEDEMTAEDLAEQVGSSRRQLERLFRRFLGKSPMAYRQELRLWRARDLVLGTGMSITEVAFASGFSSNSHFSARFKMLFGLSPREARLTKAQPEAA